MEMVTAFKEHVSAITASLATSASGASARTTAQAKELAIPKPAAFATMGSRGNHALKRPVRVTALVVVSVMLGSVGARRGLPGMTAATRS